MLGLVLTALWRTLMGRWRRGPLRPSWSFRFELFATVLKLGAARQSQQTIPERRATTEALARPDAKKLTSFTRRGPATVGGVAGEWFVPERWSRSDPAPNRTILYLHGGGFVIGSTVTHARMIASLARHAHARVFAPNYRLAPEHVHPAALEDARAVYEALLADGVAPSSLAIAGDSAGGNLALALLLDLREAWRPLPACAVLLSPWVDVADRGGSIVAHEPYDWATPADFDEWQRSYYPGMDPRDPRVSPIHAELSGLPPVLVEVGTAEMLLDQVRRLAARLRDAGVPVTLEELPDMIHDSYTLAGYFPELEQSYARLAAFVRTHTS
ncbi:alpha/beta hydrolase [Myxococcota bacterium]|nr:alpha/beta hydrolase [Myxococcota bacterium]